MSNTSDARERSTNPEEWFSILLAIFATIGTTLFVGYYPEYAPSYPEGQKGGFEWALPVWLGFFYLILQMSFLLFSTTRIGALGVLDSILAIVPVVAGLVVLVQLFINPNFKMSTYQMNTLAVLIVAGASEFLLTIWARFVINRRYIGFGSGG
jgi:hypothetical protein